MHLSLLGKAQIDRLDASCVTARQDAAANFVELRYATLQPDASVFNASIAMTRWSQIKSNFFFFFERERERERGSRAVMTVREGERE